MPAQGLNTAGPQYPLHAHLVCADAGLPGTPDHIELAGTGRHGSRAHSLQERHCRRPGVGEGVVALHAAQALQAIEAAHGKKLQVRTGPAQSQGQLHLGRNAKMEAIPLQYEGQTYPERIPVTEPPLADFFSLAGDKTGTEC